MTSRLVFIFDPLKMARRKKKRTHLQPAVETVPKSIIVKSGKCSTSVLSLLTDFKKTMEPNTSTKLKTRTHNKVADFVAVAAQLQVSHLCIFSLAKGGVNLRIARYFQLTQTSTWTDTMPGSQRVRSGKGRS
jgi:Brix domain